jgi:hypothetical protein
MRRKHLLPLVVVIAVVGLVVAGLLGRCGEQRRGEVVEAPAPTPVVDYPRDRALRALQERARAKAPATPTPPNPSRDRLTRALSSPNKDGAVMFEVNALRHSPLVDALLKCRAQQGADDANGLELLKEEFGIDVTEDVDRVAVDSEVLAVSGFFSKLQLPKDLGAGEAISSTARLYSITSDKGEPAFMARVGDDLVMTSTDRNQLAAAIERAEGRAPASASFPDGVVGGEVYGLVGPAMLQGLLGDADPRLAAIGKLLTTSAVRMAVDDDAALSLDLGTASAGDAHTLGAAINGAIAMARADARTNGNTELLGLLEQARVEPRDDGTVALDIAVRGADLLRIVGCPPAEGAPATPR